MNIQTDKQFTIFKKDGQYGPMYSIGISKKNQNNGYDVGYIQVQFKKGVEVENRTPIYIKNAWLSFYLTKDKKTNLYIFINEFEKVEDTIERAKEETDPFKEFSEKADLGELDSQKMELPF